MGSVIVKTGNNIRIAATLGLLVPLALITSCGRSPILHHHDAGNQNIERPGDVDPIVRQPGPTVPSTCSNSWSAVGYCFEYDWLKYPSSTSFGEVSVRVWKRGETTYSYLPNTQEFEVVPFMPSMGHGTHTRAISTEKTASDGTKYYHVNKIHLTMGGPWVLHFKVKTRGTNNVLDDVQIAYCMKDPMDPDACP